MRKFTIVLALLLLVGMQGVFAQTRVISGTVTSSDDKSPIPGVTVVVKSTTIGTTTNLDGKYVLTLPMKYNTIVFSYVGMKTQELTIGDNANFDVVLQPDVMNMDEIVVTAIGIPRETKALSYSVQTVGGDELQKAARTDVVNSLQGKVSDVQIINSAGVAGSASYIQIRGVQSLTGNNQPLFIVDGIPVSGSDVGGSYGVDGVATSNRSIDINPDDIESINVLKGGAATSLYGLRAASGAIVITTKKGKAAGGGRKVAINFNSYLQFDQVSQLPELQTQYAQGSSGVWSSGNRTAWGPRLDTSAYYVDPNYKWRDFDPAGQIISAKSAKANGGPVNVYNPYDFFQTGVTTNNSIAMTGGSDVSNFYFSFSDNESKGVVPNNTFRRNTFKVAGESKLSDYFKISGTANYIISAGNRIQQGSNTSGVMLGLLRTPPTFDNRNDGGIGYQFPLGYTLPDGSDPPNVGRQRSYRHGNGYDNPYWTANMNSYKDQTNRLMGSFQMDYLANKWLSFTYRLGIDWWNRKYKDNLAVGSGTAPGGWSKNGTEQSKDFNSDLIMTIDKNFAKDFNAKFILGHNMTQQFFQGLYSNANGLVVPEYYNLNNTATVSASEGTSKIRRAAIYGDLTLSWKSMVYLSVTGRNDWTTTLPQGKNSFFYPSVGAGWIFTQLPALKDNKILPYGKLRVSYAIVAKDASAYGTQTYYAAPAIADGWTTGLVFPYNGYNGYTWGPGLGNANLKPEKTNTFETGIDLKFIKNRVGLSYTYFNNQGKDLILTVPIASSSGYTNVLMNAASMTTKGHEITFDVVPIKTKDWEWTITVNWSLIKNNVDALAPGVPNLFLGGFEEPAIRAVVGQPYRTVYGLDWKRDASGNVLIGDDGYPIQGDSQVALGNVDPKWTMGAGSNLKYKDFSFYFLLDFKAGGKMWNGTRGALDYFGTSGGSANRDETYTFQGIVESTGQINKQAVPLDQAWRQGAGSGFTGVTSPYIENSNWFRVRTVTLTYSFTHMLKKTFIKGLDIYFTGTNLLLVTPYTGIDPETSLLGASNAQGIDYFNMPGTRSYTVGLNLAF